MATQEFFEAIDTDSSILAPTAVRDALNTRFYSTIGGQKFKAVNIKGNTEVVNALLPAGTNNCIGAYEDKNNKACIYFVHNSNSEHCIFRYYLDTDVIELILKNELLGFSLDRLITEIKLVDQLLIWLDVEPRELNISFACDTNKLRKTNIYFGDGTTNIFEANQDFDYSFVKISDNTSSAFAYNTGAGSATFLAGLTLLRTAMANHFTANAIPLTVAIVNDLYLQVLATSTTNHYEPRVTDGGTWAAPQNYYTTLFNIMHLEFIKYPPAFPPTTEVELDSSKLTNFIRGNVFQFRYQYVYINNEYSVLSPESTIALDDQVYSGDPLQTRKNYIEVDYSDNGRLLTPHYRNLIKRVNIFAKRNNTGQLQKIASLEQYELSGIFDFYNDGFYSTYAERDANRLNDAVPYEADSLEFAEDRVFLGGYLEGDDEVEVNTKLDIEFNDNEQKFLTSITGYIQIKNFHDDVVGNIYDATSGERVFGKDTAQYKAANSAVAYKQVIPLGFPVYLAGTEYFALATTPDAANSNKIKFVIHGVPPGNYVMRVASHFCNYGTNNIYDLRSNTFQWQNTSTNVRNMVGHDCRADGLAEYIINVPVPTAANTNIDLPADIIIDDLTRRVDNATVVFGTSDPLAEVGTAICGYLIDDNASGVKENSLSAQRMERQKLITNITWQDASVLLPATRGAEDIYTDHNGYFYDAYRYPHDGPGGNPQVDWNIEGRTRSNDLIFGTTDSYHLGDIALPNDLVFYNGGNLHVSGRVQYIVLENHFTTIRDNHRTLIRGNVKDQNGNNVEGANIVISATGRTERTDQFGNFGILIYADAYEWFNSATNDRTIVIYVGNDLDSTVAISFTTYNNVTYPASVDYDITIDTIAGSTLKAGGLYWYGLVYLEEGGRGTAVCTNVSNKLIVRYPSEDLGIVYPDKYSLGTYKYGRPQVSWEIHHAPPSFATHYLWVRTKNLYHRSFIQFAINSAQYVKYLPLDGTVDVNNETTYAASDATIILLDMVSFEHYREDNPEATQVAYTWTKGDRLRTLITFGSDYYREFNDAEILGQYGSKIAIKNDTGFLVEFQQGTIVEIMSPRFDIEDENTRFYEIGECYELGTDGSGNKYHKGPTQDQVLGGAAAKGIFKTGDTYWRRRIMRTLDDINLRLDNYFIEDSSVSDYYDSNSSDIGRVRIINKDYKRRREISGVRIGNRYLSDNAGYNGISSFEQLNHYDKLKRTNGALLKMINVRDVMLFIQEHETSSAYLGKNVIYDATQQNQIVSLSDKIISAANPLKGGGCQHPESIVNDEGRVYWWSGYERTFYRYSNDGLTPISKLYAVNNRCNTIGIATSATGVTGLRVLGVFDKANEEYVTIFTWTVAGEKYVEGIAFHEPSNKWPTRYDYAPDNMCSIATEFVSFKDGKIWVHGRNATRSNFYGVQHKQKITPLYHFGAPSVNKVYHNISIGSNKKWDIPKILIPADLDNASGMESELLNTDFETKEGVHHAVFFRNKNTPNVANALFYGEDLRGHSLELQMENTSTEEVVLNFINVNFVPSFPINK